MKGKRNLSKKFNKFIVLAGSAVISILLTQAHTKSQSLEFNDIEKLNTVSIIAQASTETSGNNETGDNNQGSEQTKKDDEITWAELAKDIKALLLSIASLVIGIVSALIKKKLDQLHALGLNFLDSRLWLQPNKKVNSILVVGKGGVGKTSLVYKLTGNPDANPNVQTRDYQIYQVLLKEEKCKFYISDYAGEKLEDLLHDFIKQQQYSFSPMRYSCITSLILLVDLFEPPNVPDNKIEPQDNISQPRIDANNQYWNEDKLSMVLKLTNNLKYVCLLISKPDLLKAGNLTEQEIKDKYSNLYTRLNSLAQENESHPQLKITRKVCSLNENTNDVDDLIEELIEYSYATKEWEKLEAEGKKKEKTQIKQSTK